MAEARGFLGAGDLYINRIVGGVLQGVQGPFECERFEVKANGELRERISKGKASYGQAVASAAIAQPFDFNITLGEADSAGIAIALLGDSAVGTPQTAGSLAAEAWVAKLDVWVPLTKGRLTEGTVVVTGNVEGTDFVVNYELGWIKALSTGTIVADEALTISADYGAFTGTDIQAGTNTSVRARFVLDGINLADSTPSICTAYEGIVRSDAAIDFLSDQFLSIPLPGRLVTPTGYTSPFIVQKRTA